MHRTLERQIKRFLTTNGSLPTGLEEFLNAVSETYTHFDEDRQLIERSLELSSRELTTKNYNLRTSLESSKELEEKLIAEKASVEKKIEERTKQFNEETARLQASINSLNIGLIMTDIYNRILTMNMAAKRILLSRPNVQTQTLSEQILSTTNLNLDIAHLQHFFANIIDLTSQITLCMQEKRVVEIGEVTYGRKIIRLSLRPILANEFGPNGDKPIIGVVIIIHDITEQKAIERSRDEFFSIASHELRTPLTAIRGNTSLIEQFYSSKLQDPELKEMISDIHESSIRLISIVNDFLDTSRLEMGRMQFKKEPFDIVPLINDVIKEYLTTGSMKKLYLRLESPPANLPKVIGDKERLKQVFINLIGNSLKFTEVGGITVQVERIAGGVMTKVIDTGKGIPLGNQSLLFRKFQQAGSSLYTRDDVHGTGLGLYISKMMMEGMGGGIWLISSELGKGTTFAINLPEMT